MPIQFKSLFLFLGARRSVFLHDGNCYGSRYHQAPYIVRSGQMAVDSGFQSRLFLVSAHEDIIIFMICT